MLSPSPRTKCTNGSFKNKQIAYLPIGEIKPVNFEKQNSRLNLLTDGLAFYLMNVIDYIICPRLFLVYLTSPCLHCCSSYIHTAH